MPAESRTIRSCGADTPLHAEQCYEQNTFGARKTVCACNESDYCNYSNSLQKDTFVLLIALICGLIVY